MSSIEAIIKDATLTFEQKVITLARYAENSVAVLNIPDETQKLRDLGVICLKVMYHIDQDIYSKTMKSL